MKKYFIKTSEIHLAANSFGSPVAFKLASERADDAFQTFAPIKFLPTSTTLTADKGYDNEAIHQRLAKEQPSIYRSLVTTDKKHNYPSIPRSKQKL